ncbi:NAD binding Rossmann fold oxidoreductase [Exidia glandulosa HHB12029]|uniref:NAD binding Rossmann fold oxidoreductase n=1 Tax=Exidia glandulosa HHB12029 TaxID=1314781 RepID=A0A165FG38_EXIGL|nr:NAD binding Rossmann fold oxidoreductase [Exidia glandulosa HHB12029]
MPLNVAVLGTGMSAKVFHVPFIRALPEHFTLHTIMSSNPESAKQRFPDAKKYVSDIRDVLDDKDIDVVCVCTPNSTHFQYTQLAVSKGKHVILEKPLCATSKECDTLIRLARSQSPPRLIAAFQNRRFDSDFLTLTKVLASGELGALSELETRYDRFRPALKGGTWKELGGVGQGVLYDLGSHLIDQVLTLFGPPARLWAHVANSRAIGDENFDDSFIAHFFYDTREGREIPLVVNLHAGILSCVEQQLRFAAKGTKGSFVKYGLDAQEAQLNASPPLPLSDASFGVEDPSIHGTLTTASGKRTVVSEKGAYLEWYQGVARALESGDASILPVKPEGARDVIRAIELCYESARSGSVVPWTKF